MSSRLLVFGALALSLVVPAALTVVAVAVAVGSKSEKTAINMPTAPSPQPSASPTATSSESSGTKRVELFGGKSIYVSRACTASHHLDAEKREAIRVAERVPALKQAALNRRRDFDTFLKRHPEKALAPADYKVYKALRAAYDSALTAYNRRIDRFNHLADRYNADLEACKA